MEMLVKQIEERMQWRMEHDSGGGLGTHLAELIAPRHKKGC
jgi:hypothetical protein